MAATRNEIPTGMWCGQEIPVSGEKNIFAWLSENQELVEVVKEEQCSFWFDLSPDQYKYWRREWDYTRR